MSGSIDKSVLRAIPAVDDILGAPELTNLRAAHPRFPWTLLVRDIVAECRSGGLGSVAAERDAIRALIVERVHSRVEELRTGGMRPVLNGTGVILHTNLGRAILGEAVRDAVTEAAGHYENVELDLESGKRSGRGESLLELIRLASGAEAAMVVNNNAAAVYIVVDSFSPPGRVIISRGELIEIGGSFRLPDILDKAAGEVIEVGTTNRTYADDYARVAQPGDVILRAHPSNYEIQGFTHEASLQQLVDVAGEKNCHVVYDLGSGSFYDFDGAGFSGEERVTDVVKTGVDCVTMSGDKLLGGIQGGIVVGRRGFVEKLKKNPLRRALRVDKITIAAMQALFRTYLFEKDIEGRIPALGQTTADKSAFERRGRAIIDAVADSGEYELDLVDDLAAIGGGSFACEDVPSVAIAVRCAAEKDALKLAKRMRRLGTPILARIKGDEVRINLRTILPYEDPALGDALRTVLGA